MNTQNIISVATNLMKQILKHTRIWLEMVNLSVNIVDVLQLKQRTYVDLNLYNQKKYSLYTLQWRSNAENIPTIVNTRYNCETFW